MTKVVPVRLRPSAPKFKRRDCNSTRIANGGLNMFWSKLGFVLLAAFLIWVLWNFIRSNPQAISAKSLNKSFFTMGILAFMLIGFVAVCVIFLKNS